MNFGEALELLKKGKHVRNKLWPEDTYITVINIPEADYYGKTISLYGNIVMMTTKGQWPYCIQSHDIFSDEWELASEQVDKSEQ